MGTPTDYWSSWQGDFLEEALQHERERLRQRGITVPVILQSYEAGFDAGWRACLEYLRQRKGEK